MLAAHPQPATDSSIVRVGIRDVQREGIIGVIIGMLAAAAALVAIEERLNESVSLLWPANLLIVLALAAWMMHSRSYLVAAWAMVASCALVPLLVVHSGLDEAIVLLAFPAGLAALFINLPAGILVAMAATATLVFVPPDLFVPNVALRSLTVLQIWGTVGLTALVTRPLITAVEWSWASYERSRTLLDRARDYQVQLKQTLEDLASANMQLTRLNEFAQTMRQVAEDSRRAKEQFVANVSHELRTPLNMIIGFSELITSSPESYGGGIPPALLADLQVILRNSRHLSELINDVLDLSQIEAGRMALTKERVNLVEIATEAKTAVSQFFFSKGLYLETEIPETLPPVLCDRTRIREVILNLLSNAARFTEKGGVHLSVWQEADDVIVAVADTGPGIAPEALSRLFQPFEQADGSIRRRHGGSGLGLAISKSFVELHGGKMWIESAPGHGATVFFRLPIGAVLPMQGGAIRWLNPAWEFRQRTRPSLAPRPVVRPRLVVAETGDALRRLLARYLDDTDLVPVASLDEAIVEITHTPAQAIVVNDASVPQAMQRMTSQPGLPANMPVIVCSIPETSDIAESIGASEYLVKPIAQDRLLAALDALDLKGKTVLVVDDEPEASRLFMRMLTSGGRAYNVLRAGNGQEAMHILRRKRKPDAVLLDLVMPEMDGFRVLAQCRSDPILKTIPIIVISARDPGGRPIVSNVIAATQGGGLTTLQILAAIDAMRTILAPQAQHGDREQPENQPG